MSDDALTPAAAAGDPAPEAAMSLLAEATARLRDHTDRRWVEVAPRVLRAALGASRRSHPLLGSAPGGPIHVSEQVVVARLQQALDRAVPGTAVRDILLHVTGQETLGEVTVDLAVRHGLPILPAADRIRALALATLVDVLGIEEPLVRVRASHVHVSEVTLDDPHLVDPASPPGPDAPG